MDGLTEQEIMDMRDRSQLAAKVEFPGEFVRRIVAHIDAHAFQVSTLEPDVLPSPPVFCSEKGCEVVPPNPKPTGLVGPWLDEGWTCLLHKGPRENSFAMRWRCPECSQK